MTFIGTWTSTILLELPAVLIADLMAEGEGDRSGWNDFTYAATAVVWGQDIDVPDIIL